MHFDITLSREVEAIQIPSGDSVKLPAGTRVIITQSLGGTYTVATDHGLARIQNKDADALGIDPQAEKQKHEAQSSSNIPAEASDLEMDVWQQLRGVYDPEIPVNIVDLGLIYDVKVNPDNVAVKISMTSPACPSHVQIGEDIKVKLSDAGFPDPRVEVVWEPAWSPQRISEAGRKALGI